MVTQRPAPERPGWLVPGAHVLVFRAAGGGEYARRDTVKTVGNHYFNLSDPEDTTRYPVDRNQEWHSSSHSFFDVLRVVPIGSSEARLAFLRYQAYRRIQRAEYAVRDWQKDHSSENLPRGCWRTSWLATRN
jgi:hypothetical protein